MRQARLVRLMRAAVEDCGLDLNDTVVLTEAASGAYVVTPVLAALAGSTEVIAVTRSSQYGTSEEVMRQTNDLAHAAGVDDRIRIITHVQIRDLERADIVTNSGHLRPLDRSKVEKMKTTAVVPLIFEGWEAGAGRVDVDLAALRERGIQFAGTNERHPAVDVFSYLGLMAVKLLLDAGVPTYRSTLAVVCDNPFADYLVGGLTAAGAQVVSAGTLDELTPERTPDGVLVALRPRGEPVLPRQAIGRMASRWPGCLVAQFWGDLDRECLTAHDLPAWPPVPPPAGHMGVLPSAIGPDPVVRLQAGGLKVGEVLRKPPGARTEADLEFLDAL